MSDIVRLKADKATVREAIAKRADYIDHLLTLGSAGVPAGAFARTWDEIAALNRLLGQSMVLVLPADAQQRVEGDAICGAKDGWAA